MVKQPSDTSRKTTFTRRSFLRGSALFTAALVGVGAMSRSVFAQGDGAGQKEPPQPASPPADTPGGESAVDPYKETKLDSRGIPYRDCPQCGGKMYKDDGKTWVCEACGYSYEE